MKRRLFIRDGYSRWGRSLAETARRRGWEARIVAREADLEPGGFGFIRLHPSPDRLERDRRLAEAMARRLAMVQDAAQIEVYEDKLAQARRWGAWMPETWIFDSEAQALMFAEKAGLPLISKAAQGASSHNVRLLETRHDLRAHIWQAFGPGIPLRLYQGRRGLQKGYVLLQRFVPHEVTYRVNAVGRQRAVFFRRCFPHRPMAQTGNVSPAYGPEEAPAGLLDFAESFFQEAATRWCALDILHDKEAATWRLLETSLAWPHPSPGDCNNGRFWPSGKRWEEMWDVLLDELEAGVWV